MQVMVLVAIAVTWPRAAMVVSRSPSGDLLRGHLTPVWWPSGKAGGQQLALSHLSFMSRCSTPCCRA
jgi:hypothetical protein